MWSREDFRACCAPAVIGMIHLPPLPGSPAWNGDLYAVESFALAEAGALRDGGLTAVMVENYHDVPFLPGRVGAETVAAMTRVITGLRRGFPELRVGVNVLRNDAEAALAVAVATGAHFIRVNVHTGAAVTDQGPIIGRAWRTLRRRRALGADRPDTYVAILADVRVKHARPLVDRPLPEEASDLRLRGLADGIIVTGAATGAAASREDLAIVREALPECPLLVGSGVTAAAAAGLAAVADGCIVGTSLKDAASGRVAADRVREFAAGWRTGAASAAAANGGGRT